MAPLWRARRPLVCAGHAARIRRAVDARCSPSARRMPVLFAAQSRLCTSSQQHTPAVSPRPHSARAMSYGAPFGVDRVPSNAGYGSYGGGGVGAFGGLRPIAPFQPAAAYNGAGGSAAPAPSGLPFGRIAYPTNNNGFAPRSTNSFLPSLPGAQPTSNSTGNSSAFPAQPYPQPPSSSPAYSPPAFINQNADSSSRQRALQGPPPRGAAPFSATQAFTSGSSAPAQPIAKFHRSRSSFIPNKWTRGPGDGTFGSIYLSFGGGDFAGRGGGGPNMAFDRPRPEELWEAEQEKKRALAFAMNPQAQQEKGAGTKKKKQSGARKQNQSKAALKALAQERAARKLLARARNHLLAHLSSSSCRLFSEADHVVAVSDDDLDELLRAGGGDAGKVVAHLKEFDAANEKFDDFAQLMRAIQEARKSAGDFGAGTETEGAAAEPAEQQQQEAKEESQAPAAAGDASTPASPTAAPAGDATASGPASGSGTQRSTKSTASSKKTGSTPRGPTIAEKRAAKKAEEDAAAAKAEQAKRAAAAKASAARAKKVQDEKAATIKAAEQQEESKQAEAPTDSSSPAATPAKAKPAAAEATTTPAKPAEASTTDAAAASPGEETYGDDFD